MTRFAFTLMLLVALVLHASGVRAQNASSDRLAEMQEIARALGVNCDYCHATMRNGPDQAATAAAVADRNKAVALGMMAMTRELNERVQGATGKPAAEAATVRCATCHRGVTIPRPLTEILTATVLRDGAAAAVAQYRELRLRHYGHGTYDFSEEALLAMGRRLAQVRPAEAILLLEMNVEFHPESAAGYAALGYAYTRLGDDATALTHLERALELQPDNGMIRGQLEQLQRFQRR